ncbi:hypothetical protein F383_20705 [Gossypium arboreum]|uniref:Uncharacterized protein n=1 Tax=Gossypium arboreum TaxID=29729 RepID=A0A0B0P3X6_GOSAR|nr:hypothetical protein F383_20705 [Gossypium arboreum]
MVSKLLLR